MTTPDVVAMVRHVQDGELRYDALMFCCPGCADGGSSGLHILPIRGSGDTGARPSWTWDGNLAAPTMDPSILTRMSEGFVCHSYLRSGVFEYLSDCTHQLVGQHVPLPPLPEWVIRERE